MKEKLIVALDFSDLREALQLVEGLGDCVNFYKVGMQLFYQSGAEIISELAKKDKKIFLDLKLHDIPNTVAGAIQSLSGLGVDMLTLHTLGGPKMMEAAAEAREKYSSGKMKIVGVTVLTSIDSEEASSLGWEKPISEYALSLAGLAKASGLDGVVASPQEAEMIKKQYGANFSVVTPGIRPAGSDIGDQSRIATPSNALASGSDFLVIGRPITQVSNPRKAAEKILEEMKSV
jgi:orotidine 5''-phosphate decarboxylase, subfamily 1